MPTTATATDPLVQAHALMLWVESAPEVSADVAFGCAEAVEYLQNVTDAVRPAHVEIAIDIPTAIRTTLGLLGQLPEDQFNSEPVIRANAAAYSAYLLLG